MRTWGVASELAARPFDSPVVCRMKSREGDPHHDAGPVQRGLRRALSQHACRAVRRRRRLEIGGKIFAAMWDGPGKNAGITFKPSAVGHELLCTQSGLRPAPYLASSGNKWVQRYSDESMSDEDLTLHLKQSYMLVLELLLGRLRQSLQNEPDSLQAAAEKARR